MELKRKVLQGTCGWSDSTLLRCGRFYPPTVKTTEDKLRHYSQHFPCVECDTSNYAIPSSQKVEKWLACVPPGFLFHFKAFGLFTRRSTSMNAIPRIVRDKFSLEWLQNKETVSWSDLPRDLKQRIWDIYNDAIFPAYKENKLGVIVFQFPLNFHPSDDNRRHVEECRGFLKEEYKMVVEFRSRMWFTEDNLQRTTAWLRNNDIGIVIADELHHELYFDSKPTTGASSAASGCPTSADVVPIVMALGSPKVCYIRVHRRVGTQRLLKEDEIHKWVERLKSDELQKRIEGPIYFMWGTDHEDQPIINSKNLTSAINDIAYKWIPTMPHGQCLLNFVPKKISSNKTGAVVENSSRQESTHDHPNGIKKKIADEMDSKNNNSQNDTSQSLPSTPTHSPSKKIRLQGNKSPKQVKLQKGQKQISSFFTKINKSQNT